MTFVCFDALVVHSQSRLTLERVLRYSLAFEPDLSYYVLLYHLEWIHCMIEVQLLPALQLLIDDQGSRLALLPPIPVSV